MIFHEDVNTSPDVLNSWKEIAQYLGRGVRTVQRWETLGLPVRRPHGRKRSAVIAIRSDLDAWIKSCSLKNPHDAGLQAPKSSTTELILDHRRFRAELDETRKQLRHALKSFAERLGSVLPDGNLTA